MCFENGDYFIFNLKLPLKEHFVWITPTFYQKMLEYLKDKKDVGFFLSIQALMQTCW